MHPTHEQAQAPDRTLTIGELAEETGLSPASLRMWESRHGFPVPQRLPSGHRRYTVDTVEQVRAVLARQAAGVRLESAIRQSGNRSAPRTLSVHAELRRTNPHLAPLLLRKTTLIAVSQAIEDECVAQGERAVLFGAFQHGRHLRASLPRWEDLARTGRATFVFSAGADETGATSRLTHVPLAEDAPMRREWSLVCEGIAQPAALSAWELPGQDDVPDGERKFETVWTLDPATVREAASICADVATDAGVPTARKVLDQLEAPSGPRGGDATAASRLFLRVVGYIEEQLHS